MFSKLILIHPEHVYNKVLYLNYIYSFARLGQKFFSIKKVKLKTEFLISFLTGFEIK